MDCQAHYFPDFLLPRRKKPKNEHHVEWGYFLFSKRLIIAVLESKMKMSGQSLITISIEYFMISCKMPIVDLEKTIMIWLK